MWANIIWVLLMEHPQSILQVKNLQEFFRKFKIITSVLTKGQFSNLSQFFSHTASVAEIDFQKIGFFEAVSVLVDLPEHDDAV